MFFEGSEKKIEVVVEGRNLRELGREYWSEIVKVCEAQILSSISNEYCDAYLLSESSLFVWEDRFVMITCGNTRLINSVLKFTDDFAKQDICSLIFQRKNEYQSRQQYSSFFEDVETLKKRFKGTALRFGYLDGHHTFLFHLDKEYKPATDDTTSELLMYHVNSEAADILRSKKMTTDQVRSVLQLDRLLPGFIIDDYAFKPYGYSLNAIKGKKYVTIHVTPQAGYSYVSFETSLDIRDEAPHLLDEIVEILNPDSFDLIQFDSDVDPRFDSKFIKVDHVKQDLICGYEVHFEHFMTNKNITRKAVVVK